MFKLLFLFFLFGKLTFGAEPNLLINIKNVEVANYENPIMGENSAMVNPEPKENTISVDFVVKDVIPEGALMIFTINSENGKKKEFKMKLCDAMHEIILGHDIFSKMTSQDKTPEKCPINPALLKLEKYFPNKAMIPAGILQDGIVNANLRIAAPNEEPYVDLKIEIEISHEPLVPKIG